MDEVAVVITVTGRVQGVSYRAHTQRQAVTLGLLGWVRNRASGQVEVHAQGNRAAVEALTAWCRRGSPGCQVDHVHTLTVPWDGALQGFAVAPTL